MFSCFSLSGIAYRGLQGKTLYPMVSSTAARSGMKVIKCCSFPSSLQFMCCRTIRKVIPANLDVLRVMNFPPGLKAFLENNISWLLQPSFIFDVPTSNKNSCKRGRADAGYSEQEGPKCKRVCMSHSPS